MGSAGTEAGAEMGQDVGHQGSRSSGQEAAFAEHAVPSDPYYVPVGDEVALFEAAFEQRTPVLLKGPTGCGKTRFLEHMSYRIGAERLGRAWPLVVVSCHEDMS